ncbi:hypothetical protein BGZ65_001865 [Modicella reniformis]|uniref:Uncharacterized protein n=1 Tax=Modicella reniformis TaxID=1440133 RepID=A0A9P6M9X0_9FUNG|nr:hypothetical protein BGZ65_001865 [Modicella reniformis]
MRFSFAVLAAAAIATIAQALPVTGTVECNQVMKDGGGSSNNTIPCEYGNLVIEESKTYECQKCRVTNLEAIRQQMLELDNKHAMYICEILPKDVCVTVYTFKYCRV